MRLVVAILIATVLNACANPAHQTLRGRLEREGQPKAYIDGYVNGCHAWKTQFRGKDFEKYKDTERFDRDSQYREGWEGGYGDCKDKDEKWNPALQPRLDESGAPSH